MGKMIRSKKSRVPVNAADKSDSIRMALYSEGDDDFIDFIEVSPFFHLSRWFVTF